MERGTLVKIATDVATVISTVVIVSNVWNVVRDVAFVSIVRLSVRRAGSVRGIDDDVRLVINARNVCRIAGLAKNVQSKMLQRSWCVSHVIRVKNVSQRHAIVKNVAHAVRMRQLIVMVFTFAAIGATCVVGVKPIVAVVMHVVKESITGRCVSTATIAGNVQIVAPAKAMI